MLSITCHLRPQRRGGGREGRLYLRVIYNRHVGSVTLPYKIFTNEWDPKTKQLIYVTDNPSRLAYLKKVYEGILKGRERLYTIARSLDELGELSTVALLKSYRQGWHSDGLKGLTDLLTRELTDEGRHRTARAYVTALRKLLSFLEQEDCPVESVTEGMLYDFESSMRKDLLSLNTISFYMRNLRAIYNKGVRMGYFHGYFVSNPFKRCYTRVPRTEKRALSTTDIRKLSDLLETEVVNKREEKLTKSLELFLFAFHAQGMSFVDLAHLKKEDLKRNILTYHRHKTGQYVRVVLTREAQLLLTRLRCYDHSSPYLFSLIRDNGIAGYRQYCTALRKQNTRLKQIAHYAGVKVGLSTHMARHSWATIAKRAKIPVSVISESLGHSSLATTSIYLDSFSSSMIGRANRKVSGSLRKANSF